MSTPWFKFYPSAWRSDPALRVCTAGARGLWIEMLCLMHEAVPRGSLLINGKQVSEAQLASLCGLPVKDTKALIAELENAGVFSREDNGTVYSRKMRRDDEKAARDKANGKGGGNPNLKRGVNPQDKPDDKAKNLEARQDTEANASGRQAAEEPILDPIERCWTEGKAALIAMKVSEAAAGSNIGRWLRESRNDGARVLAAIYRAQDHGTEKPIPLVGRILNPIGMNGGRNASPSKPSTGAVLDDMVAWAAREDERESRQRPDQLLLSDGSRGGH